MSSCNNTSNIAGNLTINSLQAVGSRLITVLPNSNGVKGGVQPGVTAGDVLRYDVVNTPNLYVKAKADDPATSEVVGVVESVNDNDVYLVLSGQMKFPTGAFAQIDPDGDGPAGSTGGAGGNDIYFLSAATGGLLQNIAPNEPTQIIKPVLQMADNGDYNAVVQNYIGYQVGGNVIATEDDGSGEDLIGSVIQVIDSGKDNLGGGYFRADKSHVLDPTAFASFYRNFGVQFGHVVRLKIDTNTNDNFPTSINLKDAYQMSSNKVRVSGKATRISSDEIEVDVTSFGANEFKVGSKLLVNGKSYGNVLSANIVGVRTPIISSGPSNNVLVKTSTGEVLSNRSIIYGIKVSSVIGVTIPDKVSVSELEVTSKLTALSKDVGKQVTDVVALLNNLDTDNKDSRTKLNSSATDNTPYISTSS